MSANTLPAERSDVHAPLLNPNQPQPIGDVQALVRAIDLIGDRWSLLIIYRALFHRTYRFGDMTRELGIPTSVLTRRLKALVGGGLLVRVEAPQGHSRHEYRPTAMTECLWPVLCSLLTWGQNVLPPDGSPKVGIAHRACGARVPAGPTCPSCGVAVRLSDLVVSSRVAYRSVQINGL